MDMESIEIEGLDNLANSVQSILNTVESERLATLEKTVYARDGIEQFVEYFKDMRKAFGFTQEAVGDDLSNYFGASLSQTTISRFESMDYFEDKTMSKLVRYLQVWLLELEKLYGVPVDRFIAMEDIELIRKSQMRQNKGNTYITDIQRQNLVAHFLRNPSPDIYSMAVIADDLGLDLQYVKCWFNHHNFWSKHHNGVIYRRPINLMELGITKPDDATIDEGVSRSFLNASTADFDSVAEMQIIDENTPKQYKGPTKLSDEQRRALVALFNVNSRPNDEEVISIAQNLDLNYDSHRRVSNKYEGRVYKRAQNLAEMGMPKVDKALVYEVIELTTLGHICEEVVANVVADFSFETSPHDYIANDIEIDQAINESIAQTNSDNTSFSDSDLCEEEEERPMISSSKGAFEADIIDVEPIEFDADREFQIKDR